MRNARPRDDDPIGDNKKGNGPVTVDTAPPESASKRGGRVTPMMEQYWRIKAEHRGELLLFRMGDFYELFFDDAVAAAAALDIALTTRGQHQGKDVPMCGVPAVSADSYLERLIHKGYRVAVCEQVEDPAEARKRGASAIVRRDVIRIVTPGTLVEDTLLDARSTNHLAALAQAGSTTAVAWIEMSTGSFSVTDIAVADLNALLESVAPAELLVAERAGDDGTLQDALAPWCERLVREPDSRFDSRAGERRLRDLYAVASLDGFGSFTRAELAAMGALLGYVELTQKGRFPRLAPPVRQVAGQSMLIDQATRRNLELMRTLEGHRQGSLLGIMDRTVTGAGARLLGQRLTAPLTDTGAIAGRLDAVQLFVEDPESRGDIRATLAQTPDLERALARLALSRGGPRDLAAIRDGLTAAGSLAARLRRHDDLPRELAGAGSAIEAAPPLVDELTCLLVDNPPPLARDGGFVRAGYSPELDQARELRDNSRQLVAGLQGTYQTATGVASLKIRHNNVLGYYVEVASNHAQRLDERTFIHRQTMANAMRYTTVELGDLETAMSRAADRAIALELDTFNKATADMLAEASAIAAAAGAVAVIDVAAALADLAVERRYTRPAVTTDLDFTIEGGRHPVVEVLASESAEFVANGCGLEDNARLWLLTGPNMAGKSTFLRQNALIAVMAQAGSYVPADTAKLGIVDRLFSRVGAADDLARGRSTFMVEMVETAAILNQAGERSLVILDEIGRGTATFDGLSIAWAVLEHLHDINRCRALFATHYHELAALAATLAALKPHSMRVKEWKNDVVFLYEVERGAANRSYGIHVARLAGLPQAVIDRAKDVLKTIETGDGATSLARLADELPLFEVAQRHTRDVAPASALRQAVDDAVPDRLTPRQALDLVYRLKDLAEEEND
ncbi:MAG: DNA mismatch repair protein MutS [Alphaproteobacteria bacterium]|nr:DNA mismatch repair protein MutS [Alphaproteobacteria bacterium]